MYESQHLSGPHTSLSGLRSDLQAQELSVEHKKATCQGLSAQSNWSVIKTIRPTVYKHLLCIAPLGHKSRSIGTSRTSSESRHVGTTHFHAWLRQGNPLLACAPVQAQAGPSNENVADCFWDVLLHEPWTLTSISTHVHREGLACRAQPSLAAAALILSALQRHRTELQATQPHPTRPQSSLIWPKAPRPRHPR